MDCLAWLKNNYIVVLWEIRKHKLYDSGSEPSCLFAGFTLKIVHKSGVFYAQTYM